MLKSECHYVKQKMAPNTPLHIPNLNYYYYYSHVSVCNWPIHTWPSVIAPNIMSPIFNNGNLSLCQVKCGAQHTVPNLNDWSRVCLQLTNLNLRCIVPILMSPILVNKITNAMMYLNTGTVELFLLGCGDEVNSRCKPVRYFNEWRESSLLLRRQCFTD